MGFKINVDRFGFAKKPEPEKVSRDYAAEYAKSLVEKEANIRNARDIELHMEIDDKVTGEKVERIEAISTAIAEEVTARNNAITLEANTRSAKDAELEEKINQETSLRNAKDAELKKYTEDCVSAEATLRESELESISTTISGEATARAGEDAAIRGRLNRLTDQERDARIAADDALGKRIDNTYTKDEVDGKIGSIDVDLSGYYTKQDIDYFNRQINLSIDDKVDMGVYLFDQAQLNTKFEEIDGQIGDIDSALDEIIALQVEKGGDAQ